jgi:peptide/nickel transport system permease protein
MAAPKGEYPFMILHKNKSTKILDHYKDKRPGKEISNEEKYFSASQWRLIWWKFRKHKIAVIAIPVLAILYLSALFADFISPTLPMTRFNSYRFCPPNLIRIYDSEKGFQAPFVYEMKRITDIKTFNVTYVVDKTKKYPVTFFGKGEAYQFLGFIKTDVHLFHSEGPAFLLGTEKLGRDMFSRILYGSRISLSIGFIGVIFTFMLGLILGGISGYWGGFADTVIQRLIDLIMCIPSLPLWMVLAAAMPRDWPNVKIYFGIVIIMSLISWTSLARVVRGKILSLREEDFVKASRISGAKSSRIIFNHMIPSFSSYIIVSLTMSIPSTIIGETSLSFLGLGLQEPTVSWGVLLQGVQNITTVAYQPWLLLPILFVVVTVLMFNFMGDGLRDAADPYK